MRIFVTGASGHIGSLVTAELIEAGHEVTGLARSDASAERVASLGATPFRATLADGERLAEAAAASDGVVHLAFEHDFSDFVGAITRNEVAVEAIAGALEGSGKPLVAASGTLMVAGVPLAAGESATEQLTGDPATQGPRAASELRLLGLTARGIRSTAVRFSPTVHGPTDLHGFIPALIGLARTNGFAAYLGDGENRWPAVHNVDAARLVRLAVERAPGGVAVHAAAEGGIPFRRIAEAIARGTGVPARSISAEEAAERLGFLGTVIGLDNPVSDAWTRATLGWEPTHPGLLEDLEAGFYFAR